MIMPTKLPDFIVNRLFLILYFVCAKKLGLKIFLSHDLSARPLTSLFTGKSIYIKMAAFIHSQ